MQHVTNKMIDHELTRLADNLSHLGIGGHTVAVHHQEGAYLPYRLEINNQPLGHQMTKSGMHSTLLTINQLLEASDK